MRNHVRNCVVAVLVCGAGAGWGTNLRGPLWSLPPALGETSDWEARAGVQHQQSWQRLFANVTRADVSPGAVIASPSRQAPDYFYHWVRDGALVMAEVLDRALDSGAAADVRRRAEAQVLRWISFEKRLQETPVPSGNVGEPKFLVTGFPFTGPWGRPQNDGPALRALTALRYAEALRQRNNETDRVFIESTLYAAEIPATTLIKRDLEYVAHHWRDPSFDLWEEVRGDHFYTRIVQLAALQKGAVFAEAMADSGAAFFYRSQADEIKTSLEDFWDSRRGFIVSTLNQDQGLSGKNSGLDVAVLLGVLHANLPEGPFSITDVRVEQTVRKLKSSFQELYPLNHNHPTAPLWGRYPEDVYDGVGFSQGHAWFISTHAAAEYYCKSMLKKQDDEGKEYLKTALRYANEDGGLSEQIHRLHGTQRGAPDLSWSHASLLSAYRACGVP